MEILLIQNNIFKNTYSKIKFSFKLFTKNSWLTLRFSPSRNRTLGSGLLGSVVARQAGRGHRVGEPDAVAVALPLNLQQGQVVVETALWRTENKINLVFIPNIFVFVLI